jgi:cyclophilin family peptidyl-prolyl cis-trans isomerase
VSIGGTSSGCIVIALDTANAPKAAGRFISLAKAGFYDGLTFHRVVPNFVIQGGDPTGDGSGGSGKPPVVGEVPKDGYPLGSLAAAKTGTDPDGTFDSQFFIVTGAQGTQLPPQYARFGHVVAGMDVAQKIEALAPATGDGPPTQKVTMDKVTIAGA